MNRYISILITVLMLSGAVYAFDGNAWDGGSGLTVVQEGAGTTNLLVNGVQYATISQEGTQSFQLNKGDIATISAPGSSRICEQGYNCDDYVTFEDVHVLEMDSTYEVSVYYE